ncbi:MAG: hypothetical protein AB1792_09260 [Candidatus Zixiibacteriota bacterium]
MKTRPGIIRLSALPAVLAVIVTGCIVSGQFIIVLNIDNAIVSTHQALNSAYIDLTDNDTWKDHEEDIQNIVDVKFEATILNNLEDSAYGEVFFAAREYTTPQEVRDSAFRVLSGILIPGNDSVQITFTESADYMPELSPGVLDLLETGTFYVYGIAETPFSITIRPGARLMVTFSAG